MADFRLLINCQMADCRDCSRSQSLCRLHAGADVADAAKARDAAAVKALLKSGADVNAAQGDGMTALHWAATNGDAALTQMLLSAGANIRATTRLGGITPLLMASQAGHAQVVAALLAAGADANSATATGATALMLAARSGNTETVTRLVETGADINAKEKGFGQTALMVAAGLDRADVVKLLMARGADWKAASSIADLKALSSPMEDGSGRPAAPPAPAGRIDVAGVTRGYRYNELIGAQGGLTALHFAVRQGSAAAARALVDAGADVNLVSPGDQASPLLVALINGHFDLAAFLIDKGANPNSAERCRRLAALCGAQRPVGADRGVSAAALAPAAVARLSRRHEAAARQGRRSRTRACGARSGTRATTSISRASTRRARRRSGAPPMPRMSRR